MDEDWAKRWAFIFEQLGKQDLQKLLFKSALYYDEHDRVVIEFRDDKAMNITEHVEEMEESLDT